MLGYDLSAPPDLEDGVTVAVLLHGRGSHRGDLQALRPLVPEPWALLTPQAPYPGHPWGYGPGWAWYRYEAEDRVVDETLSRSLETVDALLEELPALLRATPGRVVLGGFSQGGTMSLAYGLTRPAAVDAVLNFSGFLADSPVVPASALAPTATPVWWGHGTRDQNIPHALALRGRARLREAGVPLQAADYEVGHWIDPAEMRDAVTFVEGLGRE